MTPDNGRVLGCSHEICVDCLLQLRGAPITHDGQLYVSTRSCVPPSHIHAAVMVTSANENLRQLQLMDSDSVGCHPDGLHDL